MRAAVAAALALMMFCGGSFANVAIAKTSKSTSKSTASRTSTRECFRHAEAVAEQAIRYTTEVMVMSDTCRNPTYERFAQRQRLELIKFQDLMKQHFHRGGGNAQSKLDTYLTHLANESALRTGTQDIGQVCSVAVQFLATADALTADGFRQYAETQAKEHDKEYKYCKE